MTGQTWHSCILQDFDQLQARLIFSQITLRLPYCGNNICRRMIAPLRRILPASQDVEFRSLACRRSENDHHGYKRIYHLNLSLLYFLPSSSSSSKTFQTFWRWLTMKGLVPAPLLSIFTSSPRYTKPFAFLTSEQLLGFILPLTFS